jgi:hypothetical protein
MRRITASLAALLAIAGCAAKQPVLYPNAHLTDVGPDQAQADFDACHRLAADHGLAPRDEEAARVAGRTASGAAVGAASGAVGGAIWGNPGRSAAAGAAGGATAGLLSWLFVRREPNPVYRRFVEQCMTDRGYQPIGWN